MKTVFLSLALLCFFITRGQVGFVLNGKKNVKIPFLFVHNLVIVPVQVNGYMMNFLLDTGVKETMIFGETLKSIDSAVFVNKFQGLGRDEGLDGYLSIHNQVNIAGVYEDLDQPIYILQNAHIDISTRIGVEVNGIMGSRFFENQMIEMDFQKHRITLYPKGNLPKGLEKMQRLPLDILNSRPYVSVAFKQGDVSIDGRVLIDMGNSDALMLIPSKLNNFDIKPPFIDDYIGQGFNGEIYGKRNRIRSLELGPFAMNYPLVAYPELSSLQHATFVSERIGSIGNELLRRFKVVFDYPNKSIYLHKNKDFDRFYYLNMSGLEIIHDGIKYEKEEIPVVLQKDGGTEVRMGNSVQYRFVLRNMYKVATVRDGSPAAIAGLLPGDKVVKINGRSASSFSLESIHNLFKSEEGKDMRFRVTRDGNILDFKFVLKDPLPFNSD
ncbi:PDZ domain-containing protein [Sphingobacterium sp. UGAL515B_05]|uniref:PDZ domain-containing protein n=1 Tax=Sphingobacterium sp. UGAL515B_05 TaxID=2986767 RepID=UPI002953C4B1|nr:PDZ domain-containing protein [Sphingobacterium sp. UGAL515B_05]WON93138.1 PDZ domain-containing protein [Sphingobacterium sp. UGAL515B_05]